MRLRHRPSPLFLLLIPSFSSTFAIKSPDQVEALAEGKQLGRYGQILEPTPSLASTIPKANPNSAYGKTKDAPVDGKDGRPHEGPFIETAAERDRKKAKESGEEEAVTPGKKPQPKDQGKGASYTDGWKMPESNDGVMDDPNRPGPKEGTRGTEGGISEKNKAQDGQLGSKSEKKPDSPKEAPPLPHSEQEKLGQSDGKDSSKKSSEGNAEESEKPKELGGLEVWVPRSSLLCTFNRQLACPFLTLLCADLGNRNPPTCPKSHMIFRILCLIHHPGKIL